MPSTMLVIHWAVTSLLFGLISLVFAFLGHCMWVLFRNQSHPLVRKRHVDMVATMLGAAAIFALVCDLAVSVFIGIRGFHAKEVPYESVANEMRDVTSSNSVYLWIRVLALELRSLVMMTILECFCSRLWLIYFDTKWVNINDDSKWISIICANHYRDKHQQSAMDKPCIVTDTINAIKAVKGDSKNPSDPETAVLADDPSASDSSGSAQSSNNEPRSKDEEIEDVQNDFFVKYRSSLGSQFWVKRTIPLSIILWWFLDMTMITYKPRLFAVYEAAKILGGCLFIVGLWNDLPRARDTLNISEEMAILTKLGAVQVTIMVVLGLIPLIQSVGSNWWFIYAGKMVSYPGFFVYLGTQILYPLSLLLSEKRSVLGKDWGRRSNNMMASNDDLSSPVTRNSTSTFSYHSSQSSLDSVKQNASDIYLSNLVVWFLDYQQSLRDKRQEKRVKVVEGLLQLANAQSESADNHHHLNGICTPVSTITPIGGGAFSSSADAATSSARSFSPVVTPVNEMDHAHHDEDDPNDKELVPTSPNLDPSSACASSKDATPRVSGKRGSRRLSILALGGTTLLSRVSAGSVSASPVGTPGGSGGSAAEGRFSRLLTVQVGSVQLDSAGNRRPIEEVRMEKALKGGVKLLLSDKDAVPMFMDHLMSEYSAENLLCLIELVQFKARFSSKDMNKNDQRRRQGSAAGNTTSSSIKRKTIVSDATSDDHTSTTMTTTTTTVREEPWFAVLRDEIAKSDIVWNPCADAYSVAVRLCERYILSGSEYEINASYGTRTALTNLLESPEFTQQKMSVSELSKIFNPALSEVLRLMKDSFSRWNRTDSFRRYVQTVQV